MELRDYLAILRRYWLTILLCVGLTTAAAAAYDLTRPKVYRAEAAGFVSAGKANNAAEGSIGDTLAKSRAISYVDVAKSRGTADEAARIMDTGESGSALIGRVKVTQPKDTVLIRVSADGPSPAEASKLAKIGRAHV